MKNTNFAHFSLYKILANAENFHTQIYRFFFFAETLCTTPTYLKSHNSSLVTEFLSHLCRISVSMGGNFVYFGQIFNKFTQLNRDFCGLLRENTFGIFFKVKTVLVKFSMTALLRWSLAEAILE